MKINFSSWPNFTDEEADAVRDVLLSNKVNYWTGEEARKFEKEFAYFTDTKFAIALANGTVAIELALRALGIGAGDEVIVTSRSFIASASSVVTAGGIPIFADVDRESQNLSAETIVQVLSPRTRAILVVHLAGMPAEMDEIMVLARERNMYVIEDCAQAHGATYKGKSVGSIGHIGCWSFCQDKIMTTGGEGGMVTTNDEDLWNAMWSYKDHGRSYEAVYKRRHPPGHRWYCETIGTNWRMTEMQAAIGRIQLKRILEWNGARRQNALAIESVCRKLPALRVLDVPEYIEHGYYKFYTFIRPEKLRPNWTRDRIVEEIVAAGVPCYQGTCSEIYLEKAFVDLGIGPADRLPVAKELGGTSLMFLVHPTLTKDEISKMCISIEETITKASS